MSDLLRLCAEALERGGDRCYNTVMNSHVLTTLEPAGCLRGCSHPVGSSHEGAATMIDLFATRGGGGTYLPIADLIDASGDCWEWTGTIQVQGYGIVMYERRRWLVHRLVWEALVGPIPVGLDLDHLCRYKPCCNPDHLEPVTRKENVRRGAINQNVRKTHCDHGHPLSGTNLYRPPSGRRSCRTCFREYPSRQRLRTKRQTR